MALTRGEAGAAGGSLTSLGGGVRKAPARSNWFTPPTMPYVPPTPRAANPAPAPAQNYAPTQSFNPPQTPSYGIGSPTGGGIGGAPAPAPQTNPIMGPEDWLKGDSTYQNQLSEYGSSLKDFLDRLATQQSDFQADYDTSKDGLARNTENGMQALGEDFTNRGMANSGLFIKAGDDTRANYKRQGTALDTARDRALSDFGNQRKDKQASTKKANENARSASLARMASDNMFA